MEKENRTICLEFLDRGLKNSWYYLAGGQEAHAYMNIDSAVLDYGYEIDASGQTKIEILADAFAKTIAKINEKEPIDRLAFIDKAGHGPVGMIALSSLLILKSHKQAVVVRPYRNSRRSIIEGQQLRPGEKVLIISDVATTGGTVLRAANKLWEAGAVVRGALVYFDQELGAQEALERKDIQLYSLLTRSEARKEPGIASRLPDTKAEIVREFGGVM